MEPKEILEILSMPEEAFAAWLGLPDRRQITVYAMMGISNICRNQCLYCGMRAGHVIPRYRKSCEEILEQARQARNEGYTRLFLISGEDPGYDFSALTRLVNDCSALGLSVSLALGEFSASQFQELHAAGTDEVVLKFEMSQRKMFEKMNPSTSFDRRMEAIWNVKKAGMKLASGNIVDYPGQTLEMMRDDILLMRDLQISWAPILSFLPAAGTPLGGERPGRRQLCLREIAILRRLMPDVRITAQQPGPDLKEGLSSVEGNLAALRAGADVLFHDLLSAEQEKDFCVIDDRHVNQDQHLEKMAGLTGRSLSL